MRLSFAGGGTDVDEFINEHGSSCVVSMAINRFACVRMSDNDSDSKGEFISYPRDETDTDILKRVCEFNGIKESSISLSSRIDAPPRSGLGGSGALTVAALRSLTYNVDKYHLAGTAYAIERAKTVSGRQDHYAAAFGGCRKYVFGDSNTKLEPMRAFSQGSPVAKSLENSMILTFIHNRAGSSSKIMQDEIHRILHKDQTTVNALLNQRAIAQDIFTALRDSDLISFGELLHDAWRVKKLQSPGVSNDIIDAIYNIGKKAGALGGKLTGAGGGGYMFFFAPNYEGAVCEALMSVGLKPENITINWTGAESWTC